MSNWESCIKRNCLSLAVWTSNGNVEGRCSGKMTAAADKYDEAPSGTELLNFRCGTQSIPLIATDPNTFTIGSNSFGVAEKGELSILEVQLKNRTLVGSTPPADGSAPLLVKIDLKPEWQKSGSKEKKDPVGTIIKKFSNQKEFEEWKRPFKPEDIVSKNIIYLNNSTDDKPYYVRVSDANELRTLINSPEAFIILRDSETPMIILNRDELVESLSSFSDDPVELLHLVQSQPPQLLRGKTPDLQIYAKNLINEKNGVSYGKVTNTPEEDPDWDLGVKLIGTYGLRNDHNYIAESPVYNKWFPEFNEDNYFSNGVTDDRPRYYSPATGLELSGHYLVTPLSWLQFALGAQDEIALRFGGHDTANSWLFSNVIATDLSIRLGLLNCFFVGLNPVDIGWFYAGGDTTLRDDPKKVGTDIHAFVYQPGADVGINLTKKLVLEATYRYRQFYQETLDLQSEHVFGLGLSWLFGGTEQEKSVEVAKQDYVPPKATPKDLKTTIIEKKPLEYAAVRFQKSIDVNLGDVNTFFEKNNSELRGDGIAMAQELALTIKTYFSELGKMGIEVDPGSQKLTITAFADSQGKAEDSEDPKTGKKKRGNARLSKDRAQSFSDELSIDLGEDNKITVKPPEGMGEQFPDLFKCGDSCDITDIKVENRYEYRNTDKEKAVFANGKNTDIKIDKLYKVKTTRKGKDYLEKDSSYADALYGQVLLDLDGDNKEERYLEDLAASRKLTAQLKYNLNDIDDLKPAVFDGDPLRKYPFGIGGAKFTNFLLPLGTTKVLPEKLNVKDNGAFVDEVIRPLVWLIKRIETEEKDVSEFIISISLYSRITGRNTEYIGKYMAFVAGRFTDKPVRVFVSLNDRFGDSIILAKGSQTANIDPEADDENSLKLRNKWLEMLSGD